MSQPAYASQRELPGALGWLALVGFVVRNWFVSWTFFLPSFVLNFVGMFATAVVFYFMGETVHAGAADHLQEYGISYGTFIVTGVMFNTVMATTLSAYHSSCLQGYWSMQFDAYLQHPGGVSALLTGEVLAGYLQALLNLVIYYLVGIWLFEVPFVFHNLPEVVLILLLAVAALTGLGLAGASTFSLLDAKREGPNPVDLLATLLATVLAGIYFPVTVLPGWMQALSQWIPQTRALHAARLCLAGEANLSDPAVSADVVALLQFTAVSLPLGIALFALGMRRAQRNGSLTRWS